MLPRALNVSPEKVMVQSLRCLNWCSRLCYLMFGSLRRDYFQRSPISVFPTFLFELPVGTINKGIEISLWFVIVNLIVHCQSQHTTCNVPINTRSDCVKSGLMLSPGNWEKVGRDNKLLATLSTALNTPLPNHSFPIFNWEWVPSCATCNYEPLDRKEWISYGTQIGKN